MLQFTVMSEQPQASAKVAESGLVARLKFAAVPLLGDRDVGWVALLMTEAATEIERLRVVVAAANVCASAFVNQVPDPTPYQRFVEAVEAYRGSPLV